MVDKTIDKITQRTRDRIANGQFYEAHQAVRTLTARYTRSRRYLEACEILSENCQLLLKAGQDASAADLLMLLIQTFEAANMPLDASTRSQIIQLVRLFNPSEPTLKSVAGKVIDWSAKAGARALGDPELHHVFAVIFDAADDFYAAEQHYLLGTSDSAALYGSSLYDWSADSTQTAGSPQFIARGVLGYLSYGNLRDARICFDAFVRHLEFPSTQVHQVVLFDKFPLLTFLRLLILACQTRSADLLDRLKSRYSSEIRPEFQKALQKIGHVCFGVAPPAGKFLQSLGF